jgi:hypothetical protein
MKIKKISKKENTLKKLLMSIFFLFITILLLTNISAEGTCAILERNNCVEANGQYILMGLSGLTNAHGELANQENYDYVLCCDFGTGNRECTGDNKIIGLSSLTNAHAEISALNNYPDASDVCYEDFVCGYRNSLCLENEIGLLSLSSTTNAHIGVYEGTGSYDIKICCESDIERLGGVCDGVACSGASICGDYNEIGCGCDSCDVAEKSELCEEGDICLCEWKETTEKCVLNVESIDKLPSCGDGRISFELGETCDGNNFGLITGCIDAGSFTGGDLSCYPAGHEKECTLNVTNCEGGITGGICGDGIIQSPNDEGVYETCDCGEDGICDSGELNNKECADFGLSGNGLTCYLPGETNKGTFDTTACEIGEGSNPSKIGKCSYDENTDDNCEDKFLTYSWSATWEWAEENTGQTPPCEENYVLDGGLCYYDPNGAKAKCVDGSNTVPCPAQIQLPFFGNYSIVMIIGLIVVIYVFLNYREKNSKKKGKKK